MTVHPLLEALSWIRIILHLSQQPPLRPRALVCLSVWMMWAMMCDCPESCAVWNYVISVLILFKVCACVDWVTSTLYDNTVEPLYSSHQGWPLYRVTFIEGLFCTQTGTWVSGRYTEVAFIQGWLLIKRGSTVYSTMWLDWTNGIGLCIRTYVADYEFG